MKEVIIFGLATWRIASMLVQEDGPYNIFKKLRELTGIRHDESGNVFSIPERFMPELLSCVWCSSIWVSFGWLLLWLAWPDLSLKLAMAFSFSTIAIGIDKFLGN